MPPIPAILDCDPGTDDAVALWLALASPELDLRLVTVSGGNVGLERTLANARAVVGLTGKPVPVVAGADRALLGPFIAEERVHGADGLAGLSLPEGPPATPGLAADAIRAALRAAPPEGLTLIGLAPPTNLALALATEPALASRVARIVLMGGAWGEGNITTAAEFNIWNDPEALAILLATARPLTLVTLDLTAQAFVTPRRVAALAAGPGGACRDAAVAVLRGIPTSRRFAMQGFPLHDPCAVAAVVAPELLTLQEASVAVDLVPGPGRGRTHVDRWGRRGSARPNAQVAETLDAEGFFALLGQRLAALP